MAEGIGNGNEIWINVNKINYFEHDCNLENNCQYKMFLSTLNKDQRCKSVGHITGVALLCLCAGNIECMINHLLAFADFLRPILRKGL